MRQSAPMRAIRRLEAYLPVSAPAGPVPSARRHWAILAAILPSLAVSATRVVAHRADVAAMWPGLRSTMPDLAMLVGAATLVAAALAGVRAWRHHA